MDDTTFFVHSKTKYSANDVVELNDAISRLGDYSSESNIALNEAKTNKVDACFHPLDVSSSRVTRLLSSCEL